MHEWFCSPPCSDAHKKRQIPQCAGGAKRLSPCLLLRRRHAALRLGRHQRAALKAPPSRRAEGATNARRLGRHTVPRLGCHRYAVLRAPLPRRSSPLPRLLAQVFGGHQRRAPPRTTYQWQRTTTTEYVQHRSYYRLPRIKESSIKVNRVMVFPLYHITALHWAK